MSERLSTGLPRACSGAMYATVPSTTPVAVAAERRRVERGGPGAALPASGVHQAFARPKSSTFAVPAAVSLILAGFRSR